MFLLRIHINADLMLKNSPVSSLPLLSSLIGLFLCNLASTHSSLMTLKNCYKKMWMLFVCTQKNLKKCAETSAIFMCCFFYSEYEYRHWSLKQIFIWLKGFIS